MCILNKMTGSSDDVTDGPSYGWVFSIITALGLLLFLALSFAFYHRRLMVRRKKEEEYNRYFRYLRPDLAKFDKKITRARSILTNTHNLESSYLNNEAEYYNEAFEKDNDSIVSVADHKTVTKVAYDEMVEKQNNDAFKKQMEDHKVYLRSVQARKVLMADVHAEEMFGESDDEVFNVVDKPTECEIATIHEEQIEEADRCIENSFNGIQTLPSDNKNSILQKHSKDYEQVRQSSHKIVAHKPPITKPLIEMNTDGMIKKKTPLKPLKQRKKKRGLLSNKKNSVSLDVKNKDTSVFYSKPRRSSEPGLFLYNEEAADPDDAKNFVNQNKVLFNPYYTEVGMPVNINEKRRSCNAEDATEIDVYKDYHFRRERSLPVLDDIYNKHVPTSTWM